MSSAENERVWESYARSRSTQARDQLLLEYLPLVRRVATRLVMTLPRGVRLDDLISAGIVGLMSSLDNFDPELGVKFETFAINRIRGAMMDSLRELDWVPRSVRQKARRLERAVESLSQELGRIPTAHEIAEKLSVSLDEYRKLLNDANAITLVSLDSALSSEQNETSLLSDLAADSAVLSSQERMEDRERRNIVVRCLKELPDQSKLVLALYYYEEITFKEIGAVLNLTESRVSQIHSKAVAMLRRQIELSLNR